MFCYGQYSFDTNADSITKVKLEDLVLKSQNLKRMEYLKKEGDQPVEGELPTSFVITPFHICFMYYNNITVVSKLSQQIVYDQNFKDEKILRGIQMDVMSN